MRKFTTRELWVLHTVIADKIASTKSQSLVQILASVRKKLGEELRGRGEHPASIKQQEADHERRNTDNT